MELSNYELVRYPSGQYVLVRAGLNRDPARPSLVEVLLRLTRGDWLQSELVSTEARRFLPSLVLGLYEADKAGRQLSKREACAIMGADPASSGPKYIAMAENLGLITINQKPPEDRRKDLLRPTEALKNLVDAELMAIEHAVLAEQAAGRATSVRDVVCAFNSEEEAQRALTGLLDTTAVEASPRTQGVPVGSTTIQASDSSAKGRKFQNRQRMPLDTWMVVEPITFNEIKPVSTHATQGEAEALRDLLNRNEKAPRFTLTVKIPFPEEKIPIPEELAASIRRGE